MLKCCVKKIRGCLKEGVKFSIFFDTKKIYAFQRTRYQ